MGRRFNLGHCGKELAHSAPALAFVLAMAMGLIRPRSWQTFPERSGNDAHLTPRQSVAGTAILRAVGRHGPLSAISSDVDNGLVSVCLGAASPISTGRRDKSPRPYGQLGCVDSPPHADLARPFCGHRRLLTVPAALTVDMKFVVSGLHGYSLAYADASLVLHRVVQRVNKCLPRNLIG